VPSSLTSSISPLTRDTGHSAPQIICYTRRFLGGRQPLCGNGVMSVIDTTVRPAACSERIELSRPGPGPFTKTSTSRMLKSLRAVLPTLCAANWAAKGVDLRLPRKPELPLLDQQSVLPCRSVTVIIVLLNDAWICTCPCGTFLRSRRVERRSRLLCGRATVPPCFLPSVVYL
jgi:hypothetical protein